MGQQLYLHLRYVRSWKISDLTEGDLNNLSSRLALQNQTCSGLENAYEAYIHENGKISHKSIKYPLSRTLRYKEV